MTQHCEECGARMKRYWHTLSPGLVGTLRKFGNVVKPNNNMIHLQKHLDLDKNEYNNFQKLQYFGLVAKLVFNGELRRGYWEITEDGRKFLKHDISMPKRVETFRDRIVDRSTERVWISDFFGPTEEEYWQKIFGPVAVEEVAVA